MIDPEKEEIISLKEAARLPCLRVNGRPRHIATVWRWYHDGRGNPPVFLEMAWIGGLRVTSREAVGRFLAHINSGGKRLYRTPAEKHRDLARVNEELAREGI